MDIRFLDDNKNRLYFSAKEIIEQTAPGYDYEKVKEAKENILVDYEKENSKSYLLSLKNYYSTKVNLVKNILVKFNIDLDKYKADGDYSVPVMMAELIYVISKMDSSKGSIISNVNTKKQIQYSDYFEFKKALLNEIQKDYPEFHDICDEMLTEHNYLQEVHKQINDIIDEIKNEILDRMYAPFVPMDDNIEQVIKFMNNAILDDSQENVSNQLKNDLLMLSGSLEKVYEPSEYDDKIQAVYKAVNELKEAMFLIL